MNGSGKFKRFDIYLVSLDPTIGKEIKKTRPCVIISPNEMNHYLKTLIIAPMTSKGIDIPTRVETKLKGKKGYVVLDQIRSIDKKRLIKFIGKLETVESSKILGILTEIFSF